MQEIEESSLQGVVSSVKFNRLVGLIGLRKTSSSAHRGVLE